MFRLAALALITFICIGCGPKCIRGHYETRHVPERMLPYYDPALKITRLRRDRAHDVRVWICEEYEKHTKYNNEKWFWTCEVCNRKVPRKQQFRTW